ncbi:MAG: hypothetical protein KatS3mg057_2871 [Herpetosiphonaceae bacterium]|nr:MAG: hypothetical protein KatS3mg057_2871 [Herpetosiphonaceae bacterium]
MTEFTSSTPGFRFGLRRQLMGALGLLTLLILVVVLVVIIGLRIITNDARQAIEVDGYLARLAGQIEGYTLLCRRYEKDLFLNIDNPSERIAYFARWNKAYRALEKGIEQFQAAAVTQDDITQAAVWKQSSEQYRDAVFRVYQEINAGRILTPQEANRAITPSKNTIRLLTDTAIDVAVQKDRQVKEVNAHLTQTMRLLNGVIIGSGLGAVLLAVAWSILFPVRLTRPILDLQQATQRLIDGDLTAHVTFDRRDELGALGKHFNTMAERLHQQILELQGQREELRQRYEEQQMLLELVRELETPVIPVLDRVYVVPLVGHLDTRRATALTNTVLTTIHREHGEFVIIDITGISTLDTAVAKRIEHLAYALQLLGTRVILSGITAPVAQTIIELGLRFDQVETVGRLQDGIQYVLAAQQQLQIND